MHDISPVLAGTFDTSDYAPAQVNFNNGGAQNASGAVGDSGAADDSRRYSKFDRSASEVGSATMSFGDVLDLINPLQHIPVVSSVYRAVTGDSINPVSRVAGDILYGGALGVASAVASGVGAVADSVMEAKTGKDKAGTMMAALFGDGKESGGDATTQLASAAAPAQTPMPAAAPVAVASAAPVSTTPVVAATAATITAATPAATSTPTPIAPTFALQRNKMPYGGAMAPTKSMQEQNMAMTLSSATGLHIGNTVYTNRFINGPHPLPVSSAPNVAASTPATIPATTSAPVANTTATTPNATAQTPASNTVAASTANGAANPPAMQAPAALNDDALILRALGMYKNTATGGAGSGGKVDLLN